MPVRSVLTGALAKLGAAGRKQMLGINRGQETAYEEAGGRGGKHETVTFSNHCR